MSTAVLDQGKLWQRLGYSPNRAQVPLHRSSARNKVAAMGRRTGKSTSGGRELTKEALKTRLLVPHLEDNDSRREFWIVGPNYTDSEKEFRTHYNDLRRLDAPFDKPGTYYNAHDGDMQISLYDGRFMVIGKSAAHPERLVGEGLAGVIMAEAAKMRESTWTKYVRPMLADFKGWAQFNSTPEGKNWFYKLWLRGQGEEPEWDSWRLPSWYNDAIFPMGATPRGIKQLLGAIRGGFLTPEIEALSKVDPEIIAMAKDLTEETFNQEVAALFTEYVGRVFKEWDDEVHVADLAFDSQWKTYAAVDYGFTNPFVWLLLQVDVWGNVFVLREMYEPGLTIDEAADEVIDRGLAPSSLLGFYPDPASPGDTRTLEKKLRVRAVGGTGGELEQRLRLIRAMLKVRNQHLPLDAPERAPRLMVDRRCTNFIREMNDYRYPKQRTESVDGAKNAPEKPLKKDDHCPEALGRFMVGYFGADAGRGGSSVSKADMTA